MSAYGGGTAPQGPMDNAPEGFSLEAEQKGKTKTGQKNTGYAGTVEGDMNPPIRGQFMNDGLSMTPEPTDAGGNLGGTVGIGAGPTGTLGAWPTSGDQNLFKVSHVMKDKDPFGSDMYDSDVIQ